MELASLRWDFKDQNCVNPSPVMSTMLTVVSIGTSGFGRSEEVEHKGVTKFVECSAITTRRCVVAGSEVFVQLVVDFADW